MRHAEGPITMVVGASGVGIGPAVARRLAADKHHLSLIGRDETRLARLAAELAPAAASVRIQPGDATRPKRVKRLVDDMLIHYGRVDNLVYVPSGRAFGPFLKATPDDLLDHLELSLWGPWYWLQSLVPIMADHGGGRLVFVSATAGKRGFPEMAAFSAAKHALHGLVESVAREHRAAGVQPAVIVLDGTLDHPGMRRQYPDKRDWSDAISMESVADAVAFLIGQDARAMTHELWLTPGKETW